MRRMLADETTKRPRYEPVANIERSKQLAADPRPGRLVASGPVASGPVASGPVASGPVASGARCFSGVVLLVPVVVAVVAEAGRVPAGVQQAQPGQALYLQADQDQRGGGDREHWVSLTAPGPHPGGTEDRRGGTPAPQD